MEPVLRALAAYTLLFLLVRFTGKRTVAQITTFDLVLLIVVGQGIQYGLVGENYSVTNAAIVVGTLVAVDLLVSRVAHRFEPLARWIDGAPLIVAAHGATLKARAGRAGITEQDILERARLLHGLERMEQVKFAILERSGEISIIPKVER